MKTLQKTQRNDIPQTQVVATLGEGKYGDRIGGHKLLVIFQLLNWVVSRGVAILILYILISLCCIYSLYSLENMFKI